MKEPEEQYQEALLKHVEQADHMTEDEFWHELCDGQKTVDEIADESGFQTYGDWYADQQQDAYYGTGDEKYHYGDEKYHYGKENGDE